MSRISEENELIKLRLYKKNARIAYKRLQQAYDFHTLSMQKQREAYQRMVNFSLDRFEEAIAYVIANPNLSARECRDKRFKEAYYKKD